MPPKKIKEIPKNIMKIHRSEFDGESSAWFDSDGCDVCKAILSHSSFLISGRHMGDYIIVYSFVVPSFDAFKEIISTVESKGLKPKILQLGKFKLTEKVLTRKQERVLLLALRMGFFQVPRRITMHELSNRLGVGLSTLSEIIRRGMRRLLEDHFET